MPGVMGGVIDRRVDDRQDEVDLYNGKTSELHHVDRAEDSEIRAAGPLIGARHAPAVGDRRNCVVGYQGESP